MPIVMKIRTGPSNEDKYIYVWYLIGVGDLMHLMETYYGDPTYAQTFMFPISEQSDWLKNRLTQLKSVEVIVTEVKFPK